ncbi:MAG: hypothetical protein IPO48_19965 [Saprospiraceae bacterium]|nr:hypothetical protein [Saprospiraceae bacterium]
MAILWSNTGNQPIVAVAVCKSMFAWQKFGDDEHTASSGIIRGPFCW